jgi:hypothetical protein
MSEFPGSLIGDVVDDIAEMGGALRPLTTLPATVSASRSEGSFGLLMARVWIRGETRSDSFSRFRVSVSPAMRFKRALPTDRCIIDAARARLGAPVENPEAPDPDCVRGFWAGPAAFSGVSDPVITEGAEAALSWASVWVVVVAMFSLYGIMHFDS